MTDNTINAGVTMSGAETIGAGATMLANRYRVVRQLGQGGMGSVWLAEDTKLDGHPVAIKMLPSILVSNKRAYAQVKSEALVSLKLTHPNIAAVRAFEEENGNPFLVMDYIDGVTLDDYLLEKSDAGGLPESEVIRLLTPIAAALDYAHAKGVIHRDVKPANMMIAKDGTPYILDFGIAREIQETMTRVTGKLSSGTLMYMSPEQLHGAAPKSSQDVYSFAAMAYECLTGTPPFSRGQIEYQIEHDSPAPLGSHFIKCGLGVMAGLAKNPEDRPANCVAVLKGGGDHGVTALPVGGGGNGVDKDGRARTPAAPRRWGVWAALFAIGTLCAGGALWWRQVEANRMAKDRATYEERMRAEVADKAQKDAAHRQAEQETRDAEAKRLTEQLESERKARDEMQAKLKAAEEALQTRERKSSVAESGAVDSAARRKELADLANARTLIEIKRDRAQELSRKVDEYRREKDGFESHLAAFDAAAQKIEDLAEPKAVAEIKAATDSATQAVNVMELEHKWLRDNKKGRDDAKRIESEISSSLDDELVKFKASEVAATAFEEGCNLRRRGNAELKSGDFTAAGRDLASAKTKLSSAHSEAKAFAVSLILGAAKQRKSAAQWEKCVAECGRALEIDADNAEAQALRDEANGHLVPSLRLVARIGTREVEGAETRIGEKTYRTPLKWDTLSKGREVGGYRFEYSANGRRYVGTAPQWTVDWLGLKTMVVDLKEYKGPVPGDTKTVTLPGGAKLELVYCPPGSFMMGSPAGEQGRDDDETPHRVTLTRGFWIGKYEVTQRQWESVMGSNPSRFKGENRPVEQVSWEDCQQFCRKVGLGLRLPTEAEWEYACRAGTTTPYSFGSVLNGDRANCDGNYPYGTTAKGRYRRETSEVGEYRPNAWGLYDMHGNVWEWCSDWYGKYDGAATDPTGPASGVDRVGRGGSWCSSARLCRSAIRNRVAPGNRDHYLGFRVCCSAGLSEGKQKR